MNHQETKSKILEEAKELGLTKSDASVLSTDPFLVGSEKDYENAKWAARLWDTMMARRKKEIHLRGFHYWMQVVNSVKYGSKHLTPAQLKKLMKAFEITNIQEMDGFLKPDRKPYAQADPAKDWILLLRGVQMARYLGIGTWDNLIELKHPNPTDHDNYWVGAGLQKSGDIDIQDVIMSKLLGLTNDFLSEVLYYCPKYHNKGYQTYHLEVWIEKQSMTPIIEPICKKYGACYQPLVGQSSIEKVEMASDRAIRAAREGKKTRIWYLADWDRYGHSMISAVARKLEFFCRNEDLDIKLTRLALNEDQIEEYALPKAPKHGEAVVELDALDAVYPGELGKIVEKALKPYHDSKRVAAVNEQNRLMEQKATKMIEDNLRIPLENIFSNIDMNGIADNIDLTEVIDNDFIIPEPTHKVDENDIRWMFDSGRSYWEQYDEYQRYKSSRQEESIE